MGSKDRRPEDKHVAGAKARLAHLAGLAEKTDATEHKILAAAMERLELVDCDLSKLRPRVNLDDAAAERYQELTLERGQLALVIAKARSALRLGEAS